MRPINSTPNIHVSSTPFEAPAFQSPAPPKVPALNEPDSRQLAMNTARAAVSPGLELLAPAPSRPGRSPLAASVSRESKWLARGLGLGRTDGSIDRLKTVSKQASQAVFDGESSRDEQRAKADLHDLLNTIHPEEWSSLDASFRDMAVDYAYAIQRYMGPPRRGRGGDDNSSRFGRGRAGWGMSAREFPGAFALREGVRLAYTNHILDTLWRERAEDGRYLSEVVLDSNGNTYARRSEKLEGLVQDLASKLSPELYESIAQKRSDLYDRAQVWEAADRAAFILLRGSLRDNGQGAIYRPRSEDKRIDVYFSFREAYGVAEGAVLYPSLR